jgi:hypothetical protein
MLNTSEWPNDADGYSVCSLGEILESSVAPKYSLSPTACAGILRRAEKRGRSLPPSLHEALAHVAQMTTRLKSGTCSPLVGET